MIENNSSFLHLSFDSYHNLKIILLYTLHCYKFVGYENYPCIIQKSIHFKYLCQYNIN